MVGWPSRFVKLRTPCPVPGMIPLCFFAGPKEKGYRRSRAAMQPIAEWLEKLGLGRYAERFAENDIEFDILAELTDHDLAGLGVSLGHRRRILRAIQELGGSPQVVSQTAATAAPTPHDSAERRQLTVMFYDLVGSTALSAKLDLGDLRSIL